MAKRKTAANEPQVLTIKSIDEIALDPANVRKHDERNKRTVRDSLRRFGAGRSIVLDGKDTIVAGNTTVEQAREEGFTEILVVEPRPDQLVAVKRSDWTASEAAGYGIADNRSSEFGSWDTAALVAQTEALKLDGVETSFLGFTDDEIAQLGGETSQQAPVPKFEPSTADDQGTLDERAKVECPDCGCRFTP